GGRRHCTGEPAPKQGVAHDSWSKRGAPAQTPHDQGGVTFMAWRQAWTAAQRPDRGRLRQAVAGLPWTRVVPGSAAQPKTAGAAAPGRAFAQDAAATHPATSTNP